MRPFGLLRTLLCLLMILSIGCNKLPPLVPGQILCAISESNAWGDANSTYHLDHDSFSPLIVNKTDYKVDVASWNKLGSPIQFKLEGEGFPIYITVDGDENSGWLGLASVSLDMDGHIQYAVVSMNKKLLALYNDPNIDAHVLCQEIGHCVGLDHQESGLSCMNDCQHASNWRECLSDPLAIYPDAHDGKQLTAIYGEGHGDVAPPPICIGKMVVIHTFKAPDLG